MDFGPKNKKATPFKKYCEGYVDGYYGNGNNDKDNPDYSRGYDDGVNDDQLGLDSKYSDRD